MPEHSATTATLTPQLTPQRKIIHCDCDSFYASVEMRDDPSLLQKAIAVGGSPDQRGVIATCNYKAREFGLHSAMPMSQALRACPDLVIIRPNMAKYKYESQRIQKIFLEFTDLVEPLSLDEAFLDVSHSDIERGSATLIAQKIRQRVREEVGITISAGIAPNKFLAKIASDWNKPDGQFTLVPEEIDAFMLALPVKKIFGVGSVTAKKMHDLGLHTCKDLQTQSLPELSKLFGKFGSRLYNLCRGLDERPVNNNRIRKSVSTERTFARDLPDEGACTTPLQALFADLEARIERAQCASLVKARTMKIRFSGFDTTTVSVAGQEISPKIYRDMLKQAWLRQQKPVRLLGIGVQLKEENSPLQSNLFE